MKINAFFRSLFYMIYFRIIRIIFLFMIFQCDDLPSELLVCGKQLQNRVLEMVILNLVFGKLYRQNYIIQCIRVVRLLLIEFFFSIIQFK